MKKKLLFLSLLFFIISHFSMAQGRVVTGQVTSATDGSPLPGVNVTLKGTNTGTITDIEGRYSINVPQEPSTLVLSFVGFRTQEIAVGNQSTINVQMVEDARQLSEVVVVGYGTLDRRDLTGSVTSISGQEIANLPTPTFEQQLAGRAPGVQVTQPSGVLGQAPRVRIRGTNTISGGAEPLYVIDGVPVITGDQSGVAATNPLSNINPSDIESIEVLKDGASTAIYGSRAANGVILITTRRGKAGQAVINYDNYFGFHEPVNKLDLLNADEFVMIVNEKFTNANPNAVPPANRGTDDIDWQDEIFRRGFAHNHNISISGGSEKTNYFFSVGHTDQQSAVIANSLTRSSFRGNVEHNATRWLKIGTNLNFSRTVTNGLNTGANALSGNLTAAARMLPNVNPRDPNNTAFDGFNVSPDGAALGQGPNNRLIDNNFSNIAFVLANNKMRARTHRILGTTYAEATITEGLSLRTQFGIDLLLNDDFLSWDPRHGDGRGARGYAFSQFRNVTRWNWQNTLNYNRSFGDNHRINFVGGAEYQYTTFENFSASGREFSDRFFQQEQLISGTFAQQFAGGSWAPQGFDSYFGRLNYSLMNRYLFSFTVRNDAISSLPRENRRGTFLGGSVGYRISQEDFYKNSALSSVMTDVKIRASYGEVGNVDIGLFPYLGTFGSALYGPYTGVRFSNVGNPDLQWERSKKTNLGLDLAFWGDRINFSTDVFSNDIDQLVLAAPTAPSLGVPGNAINQNIGAMWNRGLEMRITTRNILRDRFTWSTDFNYSYIKNRVTSLFNNEDIIYNYNIIRVGEPIGALYGFVYEGVNPANGNPIYRKANGTLVQGNIPTSSYHVYDPNNPSDISQPATLSASADRVVLGNPNPVFQGGLTNTFTFGGFDLEIFLRYVGGNSIMNVTRQETLLNMGFQNNGREILNRWTTENTQTNVPRVYNGRDAFINNTGAATSRFVEPGAFIRAQNIILGYKFPEPVLRRLGGIRQFRVYAQVQNAFTFTRYSGLDPELSFPATTNAQNNAQFGVDWNTNPILRSFTVGLNIGL